MKEVVIPEDKKYRFPSFKKIDYNRLKLVIAYENANWIVLYNKEQESFFELLQTYNLKDALCYYNGSSENIMNVLIQIDATDFENSTTTSLEPPMGLHLYVTNGCNLRCPHCYMAAGLQNKNELTTQEIFDLLKAFADNGGVHVTFSGGEPSLREDLIEIIRFAKLECNLETEVYSNGIKWAEDTNYIINLSKYLDYIQISIDGYSENKNASLRGGNIFTKIIDSIDNYLTNNIKTTIAITPNFEENPENDVKKYIEFGHFLLEKYKNPNFRLIYSGRILDGRDITYSPSYKTRYKELINRINISLFGVNADTDINAFRKSHHIKNNCAYGNLVIDAQGNVYYCSRIPEMKPAANIRHIDFKEIVRMSKYAQKKSRVENLNPCNKCELRNICGGDCRIEYFPDFCDCSSINSDNTYTRKCSQEIKNSFYECMIKAQEVLFKPANR